MKTVNIMLISAMLLSFEYLVPTRDALAPFTDIHIRKNPFNFGSSSECNIGEYISITKEGARFQAEIEAPPLHFFTYILSRIVGR